MAASKKQLKHIIRLGKSRRGSLQCILRGRALGLSNKGRKSSDETKMKQSKALKGKKAWNKNKHFISKGTFKKGMTPWNKNKIAPYTFEVLKQMSLSHGGTGTPYEKSLYPSTFSRKIKKEVKERDNYICQNCLMTEEEHIIVFGQVLHIHHIDYNKKNNKKSNLITLCLSCNIRANFNKKLWQSFYMKKIGELLLLS